MTKRIIPDTLTSCNLLCGSVAVFLATQNNSKEKSEEHTSCKLTSVEAEEGQGTSGEAEKAKNSAQGAKRKRDTKNSTGKRATVPQIVFPWV